MLFTLFRSLLPCCSDKWSGAEVESVAGVAVCCPARGRLLLSVLWLTGTHLFKVAERTYYAPPVASLRWAAATVWPAGPGWSIFSPTLTTLQNSFKRAGDMFRSEQQKTRLRSQTSQILTFLLLNPVSRDARTYGSQDDPTS